VLGIGQQHYVVEGEADTDGKPRAAQNGTEQSRQGKHPFESSAYFRVFPANNA
jgi:hypothetical protein